MPKFRSIYCCVSESVATNPMPVESASSTENAPLERLKKIKDIAAMRKEEKGGKHDMLIKQPTFIIEQSRMDSKKKAIEIIRQGKKEGDDEFSKSEERKLGGDDSGPHRIKYGHRKSRYEPSFGQKTSAASVRPRWNAGTSTSKMNNNSYLYGEHEPVVRTQTRKQSALKRKDRSVNERQLKTKPEKQAEVKIPIVKSSVLDDKSEHNETSVESIPRYISEPLTSTIIHNERSPVFQRPDTPVNKYPSRRARKLIDKAQEKRKVFQASMDKLKDEQILKESIRFESKSGKQRKPVVEVMADIKEEENSKVAQPSRIPILSKSYTVTNSSLGLHHSRYFRDAHGQQHVIMKTIPEVNEEEVENTPPAKKASNAKLFNFFNKKSSQKK